MSTLSAYSAMSFKRASISLSVLFSIFDNLASSSARSYFLIHAAAIPFLVLLSVTSPITGPEGCANQRDMTIFIIR
jgi:hypothetical protein